MHKYSKKRSSLAPALAANDFPNQCKTGKDNIVFQSVADKNGNYTWQRLVTSKLLKLFIKKRNFRKAQNNQTNTNKKDKIATNRFRKDVERTKHIKKYNFMTNITNNLVLARSDYDEMVVLKSFTSKAALEHEFNIYTLVEGMTSRFPQCCNRFDTTLVIKYIRPVTNIPSDWKTILECLIHLIDSLVILHRFGIVHKRLDIVFDGTNYIIMFDFDDNLMHNANYDFQVWDHYRILEERNLMQIISQNIGAHNELAQNYLNSLADIGHFRKTIYNMLLS